MSISGIGSSSLISQILQNGSAGDTLKSDAQLQKVLEVIEQLLAQLQAISGKKGGSSNGSGSPESMLELPLSSAALPTQLPPSNAPIA